MNALDEISDGHTKMSLGLITTLGPPDSALIGAAEERLGPQFPETYRQFVVEVGAMEVGGRRIFGIGSSRRAGGLGVRYAARR